MCEHTNSCYMATNPSSSMLIPDSALLMYCDIIWGHYGWNLVIRINGWLTCDLVVRWGMIRIIPGRAEPVMVHQQQYQLPPSQPATSCKKIRKTTVYMVVDWLIAIFMWLTEWPGEGLTDWLIACLLACPIDWLSRWFGWYWCPFCVQCISLSW